jgi:hypothetical protein
MTAVLSRELGLPVPPEFCSTPHDAQQARDSRGARRRVAER